MDFTSALYIKISSIYPQRVIGRDMTIHTTIEDALRKFDAECFALIRTNRNCKIILEYFFSKRVSHGIIEYAKKQRY